ncbi:interferon gamma receptor 1-like [Syngnathoides biaculeatus]|uniref:interferon gamma receptor 1-like n=1 Tax=Syngnathoides biaculeatus TaxID=300417 RepID=UPI002ADDE12E|nr:interferon gamma receptor 1-like [Syngnathoides biaculeatus]
MELTRLSHVVVFLFLSDITSAYVVPPSNVTLQCGNLVNKVSWNYDRPPAGLRFRVDLGQVSGGNIDPVWVELPDLQADLSFLSDQRNDYVLTVTAVLWEEESEAVPAEGISFSYFIDSPATQKCSLDFPPVTVSEQKDNIVSVSFQHPWLMYHHGLPPRLDSTSRKRRRHEQLDKPLPVFKYDVTLGKNQFTHLQCTEEVCEHKLPADAVLREHCAVVRGELERIAVRGTQEYCAHPVQGNRYWVILVVLLIALILIAVCTTLFMVWWKKTKPSSDLPPSLRFDGSVEELKGAPLTVSNSSAPLLFEEQPPSTGEAEQPPSTGEAEQPHLSCEAEPSGEDEVGDAEEENPQAYVGSEDIEEDDGKETLDNDPYERRNVVVRLSLDEDVEGYRG